MTCTCSVWDRRYPWASIAYALEYWPDLPAIIVVPNSAPASSLTIDSTTVPIKEVPDALGVVCQGHQPVDPDAKRVWIARIRREERERA